MARLISIQCKSNIKTPNTITLHADYKVIHLALKATLLVGRTTPNLALHRKGGILLACILLEEYRSRLTIRLNSLDDSHPFRFRASVCLNVGTLKFKTNSRLPKRPEY